MSLQLITGFSPRQLADEAFRSVRMTSSSGAEVTWAVPDNATAALFTRRLASERCVIGIRVVTADRLLQSLWERYGDGRQLVGSTSRSALISRFLESRRDRLSGALIQSRNVQLALKTLASQSQHTLAQPAVDEVTQAFAEVLQIYHCELDAIGLVEPIDAAAALRHRIPMLGTFVFGPFGELSPTQETLLESIAHLSDVSTLHVWDRDTVATRAITPLIDRLSSRAVSHKFCEQPLSTNHELSDVVRSIGGESRVLVAPEGSVEFGEVTGDSAEAVLVAEIVAGEISAGRSPGDIYISCPDLGQKYMALVRALDAFDIGYEADVAIPFRNTELGSVFLSLFGIDSNDAFRSASRLLHSRFSPLTHERAHAIDKKLRSRASFESAELRKLISGGSRELHELLDMAEAARNLEIGSDWAKHMLLIASRLLALSVSIAGGRGSLREDAAAHSAVSRALSEAVEASRGISVSDFLKSLGEVRVASGAVQTGAAVKLVEFRRLRSYECPVLVLCGLNADRSDVTSRDGVEDILRARLGYPARVDIRAQSDFDTFFVLSGVSEKLILTRASRDAGGTENRPAYLWDEIRSRYDFTDESSCPKLHTLSLSNVEMAAPTMDASRRPLRAAARGRRLEGKTVIRGRVSDPSLHERQASEPVSITAIEKYLQCPYQWFVEKVLSPQEIDLDIGARARGSVIHSVLQYTTEYVRDRTPQRRVCDDNFDLVWGYAKRCIEAELEERDSGEVDMRSLLERRAIQSAVLQSLKLDIVFPPEFRPYRTEWEFGREEPVFLGGVRVAGAIDRVDTSRTHVAVIDYKSGTGSLVNVVPQDWHIQYLAYGIIASRALSLPIGLAGYRFLSGGKFSGIGDDSAFEDNAILSRKQRWSSDAIERAIFDLESRIGLAYQGMRDMKIEPTPTAKACRYCAANTFCARRIT